ncbi:MAG: PAS domain-containing sensor histidine kinase [Bryobacteraceae bacterium]
MCLYGGGCARFPQSTSSGPLTTVEQVRQLTPEAVGAQVPVRLHGTVTYVDGAFQLFLVQDATGAVRVEGLQPGIDRGASVDLQGTVASGGPNPDVTSGSIRVGDRHSPLPAPARPSAHDLASGRLQYRYVEIEGVVKSAIMDRAGRFSLTIRALGWDVHVLIRNQSALSDRSLVDAVVRARGDLSTSLDARGVAIGVKLWVTALEDVEVVKPAPSVANLPVTTVRSVLLTDRTRLPDHRIRLHGSVSVEAGKLTLRDSTGTAPLQAAPAEPLEAGRALDVLCFVGEKQGTLSLTACTVWDQARKQRNLAPLPVLTTVSQVKELSEDEARRAYPVHLHAVVTYHNPVATNTFLQDRTGGIYVFFDGQAEPTLHAGDLADLEGFSGPGQFAPIVRGTSVHVVGRQALPEPLRADMEHLFAGIADSTWVEAEGIVHSIRRQEGSSILGVNWGIHHFSAFVFGDTQLPESLLDSHVHLMGVCGTRFNFKRQILGMQLFVPDASFIRVEGGAPHAPPLRNIDQLLQFSSAADFGKRSRVRGVVILTERTGPTYVSDSTGGVLIQSHLPATLKVGDSVEVTGLPVAVSGIFNPVFRDAEIHKLGRAVAPDPVVVTASDILEEGYDAQLIQIDALLVDQGEAKGNQVLLLQAGDRLFEARIDHQRLPPLEKGAVLRVTGIASIQTYESQQTVLPQAFSILLRTPGDIVVLQPAPWLTAARTFRLLGLVCAVAMLALAWIVVLRGRVRQQTAELRGSRQMLQLVLDHVPQRVFWKDREGRFLGCNKAFASDAGVPTAQDIVGKTVSDFSQWSTTADLYTADDRQVIETGQAKIGYEEAMVGMDGKKRCLRSSKVPLPGSIGGVIGVLGTYEDITENKRAEAKLQHYSVELAETNEDLKRFTQIVSHDLRAPLVNLKGFSVELRQSIETLRKAAQTFLANLEEPVRAAVAQALQETIPEALGFIESSVTRIDHLTAALLRLSRAGRREFHMEELDAGTLVQETVGSLAHQIQSRNIALEIGPLPRIASDRTAIEQIFGNLLDNAIKYLDPQRPQRIEVSAVETADAAIFRVRDTGRGIAEEDMDKVFQPFRRAGIQDVPGEGMGLAFVRMLLHRLGGRIECHSQLGVGTTFSFMLPKVR